MMRVISNNNCWSARKNCLSFHIATTLQQNRAPVCKEALLIVRLISAFGIQSRDPCVENVGGIMACCVLVPAWQQWTHMAARVRARRMREICPSLNHMLGQRKVSLCLGEEIIKGAPNINK